jgi:hypothetical protein
MRPGWPEGVGLGGHEDKGEPKGDRERNESGVSGELKGDGIEQVGVLGLGIDKANGSDETPTTGSKG